MNAVIATRALQQTQSYVSMLELTPGRNRTLAVSAMGSLLVRTSLKYTWFVLVWNHIHAVSAASVLVARAAYKGTFELAQMKNHLSAVTAISALLKAAACKHT